MQSFTDGIMKVQASRRDRITEIMYILGDGSIHIWP